MYCKQPYLLRRSGNTASAPILNAANGMNGPNLNMMITQEHHGGKLENLQSFSPYFPNEQKRFLPQLLYDYKVFTLLRGIVIFFKSTTNTKLPVTHTYKTDQGIVQANMVGRGIHTPPLQKPIGINRIIAT